MYDPKSSKAEEFISHQEVLDTLEYAEKNKNNSELINSIIEKAKASHIGKLPFCWIVKSKKKTTKSIDLPNKSKRIFTETEL